MIKKDGERAEREKRKTNKTKGNENDITGNIKLHGREKKVNNDKKNRTKEQRHIDRKRNIRNETNKQTREDTTTQVCQ